MSPLRMYCATPHIGHGLDGRSFETALEMSPNVVVAQGTSTDPGPYYLGTGTSYMQRLEVKKDLRTLLSGCKRKGVPFIVSLGGAGDNRSLARDLSVVDEIAQAEQLKLRVAVIEGEIRHAWLQDRLRAGARARRIADSPFLEEELSIDAVAASARIVAQMGPEPIVAALREEGIDGVITGRALDVGLFVAFPLLEGYERDTAMHFATVMHDGALACIPGSGSDGLLGRLAAESFEITTPNPARRCTPVSVAAMSFYERPNPFLEAMPGGQLDVTNAVYTALDERTVQVRGARWTPAPYTVKIEGAALQGYRAICLGGACDPGFLRELDEILAASRARIEELVARDGDARWELAFRVYGRDAVRGASGDGVPAEVGILIDVLAEDPEVAAGVCSIARSTLMHQGYPGRKTTAGNLAVPFSPVEVQVGQSFRFNIWHAVELEDPLEPFPARIVDFPRKGAATP